MKFFIFFVFLVSAVFGGDDFYELLGLNKDADNRDIRRAFKKLAMQFHPDKNQVGILLISGNFFKRTKFFLQEDPKAHEKFVKINRAYEVLKDEELRKKYDLHGEDGIKDGFNGGGQNYQSWNFYKEQFGKTFWPFRKIWLSVFCSQLILAVSFIFCTCN